jgi:hypothetical protein
MFLIKNKMILTQVLEQKQLSCLSSPSFKLFLDPS